MINKPTAAARASGAAVWDTLQTVVDVALMLDEDEHRGDAPAQNPLLQHFGTETTPDPSTQIR
jgi:hypothetical protein